MSRSLSRVLWTRQYIGPDLSRHARHIEVVPEASEGILDPWMRLQVMCGHQYLFHQLRRDTGSQPTVIALAHEEQQLSL